MNGFGLDVPYTHATTGKSYVAHMDSSQKVCGNPMGLQAMLKELGFYAGPVDGKLGPATTNAMAAFANAASPASRAALPSRRRSARARTP